MPKIDAAAAKATMAMSAKAKTLRKGNPDRFDRKQGDDGGAEAMSDDDDDSSEDS